MRPAFSSPSPVWTQDVHAEPAPQMSNWRYTLGPLDVLKITLYERPELEREVTISRQGTFQFPMIGQVQARGLTVSQLERTLTRRLQRAHIPQPHVVVTVKAYHNQHVFLLGQVKTPGVYALPDRVDLRSLIIQAHGLTAEADDYLIIIHRDRPLWAGRVAPVRHLREVPGTRVDLHKLMSDQEAPGVLLRSGDTIYVPRRITGYAASQIGCATIERRCPIYTVRQTR